MQRSVFKFAFLQPCPGIFIFVEKEEYLGTEAAQERGYALAGGQVPQLQRLWHVLCCRVHHRPHLVRDALSQLRSEKLQPHIISLFPNSLKPKAFPCTSEEGISASLPQPSGRRRTTEQTEVIHSVMERTEGSPDTCTYLENLNLGKRIEFLM